MSSCEKCWSDSYDPNGDQAARYAELIGLRHDKEFRCSAEEQAGPCSDKCQKCGRMTLHQYTGEPMCGCKRVVANGSAAGGQS